MRLNFLSVVIWWGYRMAKGSRTVAYGDMRFDGYGRLPPPGG